MRMFPVFCSMNYVGGEEVPEVKTALEASGYFVYEASMMRTNDNLIDQIEHYFKAAEYTVLNSPLTEVAVLIHYDNPADVFNNKKVQKLFGSDPFINYVDAANQETTIYAFRNGVMERLYQAENMSPFTMLAYHDYINYGEKYKLHIVPVKYKQPCIPGSLFSACERWYEVIDKDSHRVSYLRTRRNAHNPNEPRTALYEALQSQGVWRCGLVPDRDAGRRFISDIAHGLLDPGWKTQSYECYEIIGTNSFLLLADEKSSDLLISLSSTDEEMNKLLNSKLFNELMVRR
ncbi:hypothetical protein IKX12_01845 [Candidatus Saccharibacteria bacterium]|nr:hypothetical protein [Candidatus Saccharibacteria bacterium]